MRGHIRQRGKRSWQIKFDDGRDPSTGKRRIRYKTVSGTKREAERELNKMLSDLDRGSFVDAGRLSTGQFLKNWLSDHAAHSVSRKTFERYEEIVRTHLVPKFGALKLSALRPSHIQRAWGEDLLSGRRDGRGGLSARTIQHHHRVLSQALSQAVRLQLLAVNPATAVSPPRPQRREILVLQDDELASLLRALEGNPMYVPVLLAATTGLRRGEVFGLRWKDIDLDRRELSVSRTLEQTRTGLRFKAPKTARSRRTVSLAEITVETLRTHRIRQASGRLALGLGKDPTDLVFADHDGAPVNIERISRKFSQEVTSLGLPPVTFHGLRHTHITNLLKAGIHPKIASERAGHASISITLDTYSHVVPGMQEDAAKKVDAALRTALEHWPR